MSLFSQNIGRLFSIGAVIVFTVCLLLPGPALATSQARILVLGDSLSAAYGIPEDAGWVALLQEKLVREDYNFTTLNASITGDTSGGGAQRLPALLNAHQPRVVIVELGGNDGLRGLSLRSMQNNLERIIQLCADHNTQVLLLGIKIPANYGTRYTQRFYNTFEALSTQYALPLVPFFLQDVALDPSLMQADGIHPNTAAQPKMLARVWPVLEPLLH